MLKVVNSRTRPAPVGYSHAVEVIGTSRQLYVAGQVGRNADGHTPDDMAGQARIAIANITELLEQAGMNFTHVAKAVVYLTDENLLTEFTDIWYAALPSPPPAVTGVIVKALVRPEFLVEVEVIAHA